VFSPTASYGHFGNPAYSWEKTDKAAALKDFLGV
jgi:S-adenosylmethionine synthetase